MQVEFRVLPGENRFFLRDILRNHGVSAALSAAVKADAGFFYDGRPVHTNVRLPAGGCVCFALPPEPPTSVTPQELPLSIVYEDAHTMVLNKPAGQAVHPTLGYRDGTLANAFCGEMQRRGLKTLFRPVNRLDRNTSGLVLCALDAYAAPLLAHSAQKAYYAVLQGTLGEREGVIDAPIALCEHSLIRRRVAPEGKPSQTFYTVLAEENGWSLVRAVPQTGRTHQLRVHFAWMGAPLAGDTLYGGAAEQIGRHALHCGELWFSEVQAQMQGALAPREVRLALAEDMQILVRRNLPHFAAGTAYPWYLCGESEENADG